MFIVHVHALDEIEHEKQKKKMVMLLRQQTRRINRHAPCVERENAVLYGSICKYSQDMISFAFLVLLHKTILFLFQQGVTTSISTICAYVNTLDSLHLIFYSSCRNVVVLENDSYAYDSCGSFYGHHKENDRLG